jgi:hypothetical protein
MNNGKSLLNNYTKSVVEPMVELPKQNLRADPKYSNFKHMECQMVNSSTWIFK